MMKPSNIAIVQAVTWKEGWLVRDGARLWTLEEYKVQITHATVKLERRRSIRMYLTNIYLFLLK